MHLSRACRCTRTHAISDRHSFQATKHCSSFASQESFEGAKAWVRELKLYGQPNVVIALAANKCDLEQYRVVSMQEGQAYAKENDMIYFESSAKAAHNVRRVFVDLAQCVPRKDILSAHATLEDTPSGKSGCAC